MKRLCTTLFSVVLLLLGAAFVGGGNAWAGQPPAGYNTAEILFVGTSDVAGTTLVRRGFYDGDLDQGFGYDKAYNKHGVTTYGGIQFVIESPNAQPKEAADAGWRFNAYVHDYECKDYTLFTRCDDKRQVKVFGASNTQNKPLYYGWPAGDPVGLQTVYCDGYNPKCPRWAASVLAAKQYH